MNYDIHTDVKYGPLEVVEAGRFAEEYPEIADVPTSSPLLTLAAMFS